MVKQIVCIVFAISVGITPVAVNASSDMRFHQRLKEQYAHCGRNAAYCVQQDAQRVRDRVAENVAWHMAIKRNREEEEQKRALFLKQAAEKAKYSSFKAAASVQVNSDQAAAYSKYAQELATVRAEEEEKKIQEYEAVLRECLTYTQGGMLFAIGCSLSARDVAGMLVKVYSFKAENLDLLKHVESELRLRKQRCSEYEKILQGKDGDVLFIEYNDVPYTVREFAKKHTLSSVAHELVWGGPSRYSLRAVNRELIDKLEQIIAQRKR